MSRYWMSMDNHDVNLSEVVGMDVAQEQQGADADLVANLIEGLNMDVMLMLYSVVLRHY